VCRNPWGSRGGDAVGEWDGAWSDGSKEWTPYWMNKLGHSFDDDGVFWMSFEDMMITFSNLHRTRLFDSSWTVVQEWTSVSVAWLTGYLQRKFVIDVKKAGVTVFVLSQVCSCLSPAVLRPC
jgi:calpain family cysteine protease